MGMRGMERLGKKRANLNSARETKGERGERLSKLLNRV